MNEPESEVLLANPFRYRGYYYDTSIGLYYLNSRYYDPEVGRFLNEDLVSNLDPETIGGINPYAYCLNDPVNNIDPSGTVALLTGLLIAVGIGAAVGAVSYTVSEVISYAATGVWTWSWGMFLGSTIGGAAGGALSFFAPNMIPFFSGAITGFSASVAGMCLENALGEANHTGWEIFKSSLVAAGVSALAAGITSKIKIRGVTSGRGSFQQVYKQINTKFLHGTIHSIKLKTFGKMFAYVGMTELLNTISSACQDILSWYEYLKEHPLYGNL